MLHAVCCEVVGTVGQRIFDGQRILDVQCIFDSQGIFDAVSRALAADLSALAAGQHIWFLSENLLCELVRPTIVQILCLLVPMHHRSLDYDIWAYSNDSLVISDRIVGFQDRVGNSHLFCVEYLVVAETVFEACIVHGLEVPEMDCLALVDLAFDLCRVVGFQIGLVFVPGSRGLERLVGCLTTWLCHLEVVLGRLDAQPVPASGHRTFGVAICRLPAFVVCGSLCIAGTP